MMKVWWQERGDGAHGGMHRPMHECCMIDGIPVVPTCLLLQGRPPLFSRAAGCGGGLRALQRFYSRGLSKQRLEKPCIFFLAVPFSKRFDYY
jgi:hypothetical protein